MGRATANVRQIIKNVFLIDFLLLALCRRARLWQERSAKPDLATPGFGRKPLQNPTWPRPALAGNLCKTQPGHARLWPETSAKRDICTPCVGRKHDTLMPYFCRFLPENFRSARVLETQETSIRNTRSLAQNYQFHN